MDGEPLLSWLACGLILILAPLSIKIAYYSIKRKESNLDIAEEEKQRENFQATLYIHVIIGYCCLLLVWYQILLPLPIAQLAFYITVNYLIAVYFPYLRKSSKYRAVCRGELFRNWSDKLVWSSGVYGVAALYALYQHQFQFAFIAFATCIGSTLYHLNRETRYFNLDNIFATAMMFMFLWTLYDAFSSGHHYIYLLIGGLGLPVALFLLKYCGMPADIIPDEKEILTTNQYSGSIGTATDSSDGAQLLFKSGQFTICCIRDGREEYDLYHTLWHFASGIGPIMAVVYVSNYSAATSTVQFEHVLPYYAMLMALGINLMGNRYGIMPLD